MATNFSDAVRRMVAAEMKPLVQRIANLESLLEQIPDSRGQFIDMKGIMAKYPVKRNLIQADISSGALKARKTAGASAGKLVFDRDDVAKWFYERFPERA